MLGTYIQRGETIDYVNAGAALIPAGTVVSLTTRIGIAGCDIAVGATGSLHLGGVFEGAKAAVAIAQGEAVFYDPVADNFTNVATSNIPAGWAVAAELLAATTVNVQLLGVDITPFIAATVAAVAVADGVAVAVADGADAAGANPTKAEFDAVVDLANANKAGVNALVTLANATKAQLNAVIAALKAAGLMTP
jgi:predicted RecA/RadA family phage recombinase